MGRGNDTSSDRLTVIFLVAVCLLFVILVAGVVYFLYITVAPMLAPAAAPEMGPTVVPGASNAARPTLVNPTFVNVIGDYTGPTAYVCQKNSRSVEVLETATGRLLDEITLSHQPAGVVTSHDGKFVYVTDGSSIAVVEAITNRVANHIPASQFTTGYLVVSPDDRRLYTVCNGGLSVMKLEAGSGVEIGFVDGVTAMGIGISPDGRYVYTTDWGNCSMQVINTGELRIEKTIDLVPYYENRGTIPWEGGQVKAAGQAVGLAVSPDGRHAVIGIWAGSFAPVVDLVNQTLEKAVSLGGMSYQCVAFSPDGKRVYISHYNGDRIIVLYGATLGQIGAIKVAAAPKNIAITPDGKYLYVAHEDANVEIVSLSDYSIVRTLDIVASPSGQNIAFSPAAGP